MDIQYLLYILAYLTLIFLPLDQFGSKKRLEPILSFEVILETKYVLMWHLNKPVMSTKNLPFYLVQKNETIIVS